MPINEKLMKHLKKEYWRKKWEEIYYAMEMKAKKIINKNNK
jgi:hypothetical protein